MENKSNLYITILIISILLVLIFRDINLKNETKENGIDIIVKFDSVKKLPKTTNYFFSYYLDGKKISTCNSGLEKLFEFNKINVVQNKFYKAKRNSEKPEIIIVNQEEQVLDTKSILKAGFSREDIENMPKQQHDNLSKILIKIGLVNQFAAHNKMIKDMHNTTGQTAKVCYAVAATLTGTAYLMPVLVAASPAIQSTVATLVTNPSIQQIALNAGSQFIANGGVVGDINIIEAGLSGVPGTNLIPTIVGESFSFSINKGYQPPAFDKKWAAQVGGGVLSNRFGKATDSFLGSEGVQGKVAGEYFKFIIETGSNAAPNLIEEK